MLHLVKGIYPVSSAVELSRRRRLAAAADRSQRTRLPAGASGTAGSEGHSSSPDVVRPALLPQARPRPAGCAEHRPEPLLQGRLRGLPQRIYSRAEAARGAPYGAVETEGGVALFRRGEQPADSAQRGPALQHIVRLHDAAFCWQMNIFHLSSEVKLEQLRHHDGYEHAMFYLGKGMKQLSKFGTLTAAETRRELLLFTDTPLGTGCYEEM